MYIKNCYNVKEIQQFNIVATEKKRIENLWIELTDMNAKRHTKMIIGGVYRHPDQNITEFKNQFEVVLDTLPSQSLPCIIADDTNIDLLKCGSHSNTAQYVDNLMVNNFIPTVLMQTRITKSSATLIDHMYYYEGDCKTRDMLVRSGNFLTDISNHLPNFTVLIKALKTNTSTSKSTHFF